MSASVIPEYVKIMFSLDTVTVWLAEEFRFLTASFCSRFTLKFRKGRGGGG